MSSGPNHNYGGRLVVLEGRKVPPAPREWTCRCGASCSTRRSRCEVCGRVRPGAKPRLKIGHGKLPMMTAISREPKVKCSQRCDNGRTFE